MALARLSASRRFAIIAVLRSGRFSTTPSSSLAKDATLSRSRSRVRIPPGSPPNFPLFLSVLGQFEGGLSRLRKPQNGSESAAQMAMEWQRLVARMASCYRFLWKSQTQLAAATSFYDLTRPQQERWRDREPQRLGGLRVDHELELGRLLDREIPGLGAREDLVYEDCRPPVHVGIVGPKAHEPPGVH